MGYAFSQAVINVQNGNVNHFYSDFEVPGHGFPLKLERSYNSKSTFVGMFGRKWGSNFDVTFTVAPEGLVEIREFGGGFITTFTKKGFSKKDIDKFVDRILKALVPARRTAKLKKSLKTDPAERRRIAKTKNIINKIPLGTKLHANDRGKESLKKTKKKGYKGYIWIRTFADGKQEYFNASGRLILRRDANNNFLKFAYNAKGRLIKVVDRIGRQIIFHYDTNHFVKSVISPLGKKCLYKVDKKSKNLVFAKNARGFSFYHEYNTKNHMTKVKYPKGRSESMAYDNEDRVTLHKGTKDITSRYKYDTKGNPNKYFNVVVSKEIGKKPNQVITVDKYEYEFGRRDNGSKYTYKLVTALDGIRTETIYTPCCGKPISINRQGKVTRFEYNKDGALTRKIFPSGRMVSLRYDKKFGKVAKVTKVNPRQKSSDVTHYKYDRKGNLAFAQNKNRKISVRLVYDTKGRIKTLIDQTGKKITFKYNELGKPTKITLKGTGSIIVSYNAAGKITNVKSTGGRRIASEVTGAFQTLLDVIRPAGVSLNI